MKRKESGSGKVIVIPTCRRSGTDARKVQSPRSVGEAIGKLRQFEELEKISSRLTNYAASTGHELQKLKLATETRELDMVRKVAETLAKLAAEVGATGMLRICYQVLIAARQGQHEMINSLQSALHDEFLRFKSSLQLAT